MALTARQQRFVEEYLIDLNATQAAIRAGFSPRAANRTGSRLLSNVDIQTAIQAHQAARTQQAGIDAARVLRELGSIAFLDPRKLVKWGPLGVELLDSSRLSDEAAAAVESVSQTATGGLKIKFHSKHAALRILAEITELLKESTPLEELLDQLPPELAAILRAAILQRHATAVGSPGTGATNAAP